MSQPPLSRQIRTLEDDLGVQLFHRDTHNVNLTEAGHRLEKEARQILKMLDDTVEQIGKAKPVDDFRLKVGVTNVVDPGLIPPLPPLLASHGIDATVVQSYAISRVLAGQVKGGALDLAIVGAPSLLPPGLTARALFVDPMVVALPEAHPAARDGHLIEFRDLSTDTLLWFRRADNQAFYDAAAALFEDNGYRPPRKPEPDDVNMLLREVAAGEGVAFLPSSMMAVRRPGVAYRRFAPAIETRFAVTLTLIRRSSESRALTLEVWERLVEALSAPSG